MLILCLFKIHQRNVSRSRHLFVVLDRHGLFLPASGDTANLSMLLTYMAFAQQRKNLALHAYVQNINCLCVSDTLCISPQCCFLQSDPTASLVNMRVRTNAYHHRRRYDALFALLGRTPRAVIDVADNRLYPLIHCPLASASNGQAVAEESPSPAQHRAAQHRAQHTPATPAGLLSGTMRWLLVWHHSSSPGACSELGIVIAGAILTQ